jgi:hypothetical protein
MFEEKVEQEPVKINESFEFRWSSINIWFFVLLLITLWFAFNRYVETKNFHVIIETPCDPAGELCFFRDCDKEECPPNGLSTYRSWDVNAKIFYGCDVNNTCESTCENETGKCKEIVCNPEIDMCKSEVYYNNK